MTLNCLRDMGGKEAGLQFAATNGSGDNYIQEERIWNGYKFHVLEFVYKSGMESAACWSCECGGGVEVCDWLIIFYKWLRASSWGFGVWKRVREKLQTFSWIMLTLAVSFRRGSPNIVLPVFIDFPAQLPI